MKAYQMNNDKLDTIFDMLCDDFIRMLKDEKLGASDRKTLLEFLKDNNVKVNGTANSKIKNILQDLPFDESNVIQM